MLTQPINISVKGPSPPAQARLPSDKAVAPKGKDHVETEKGPDLSRMTEMVADVQENLSMIHNVDVQFSVHEASGEIMITVMEGSTGEVIREIPPLEILNLAAKLDEMVGLIFDQRG
jgi:uncharacterized FlaG/YvyC family protein